MNKIVHNYIITDDNIDDFFFTKNGKLISEKDYIDNNIDNIDNIECHRKIRGGDVLDTILDAIFSVFDVIFKPIGAIGKVFIFLLKFTFWLLKFMFWFIKFSIWMLTDLLNPVTLINDFFNSLMLILHGLVNVVFLVFNTLASLTVNTLGGMMQGLWGWDMSSLTKNDKNSKYFKKFDRIKGAKTYLTNTNTVPFSIILGTILCPPMGVFMDLGLSGWLNIVICALLTLLFYLPGLCYALLIIYS